MKYCEQSKKIYIETEEFVSVARRGISPTLPFDENEPSADELMLSRIYKRDKSVRERRFTFDFKCGEYDFSLGASILFDGDDILVVRGINSSVKYARKEEIAQIRAEGHVEAFIYLNEEKRESVRVKFLYVSLTSGEQKEVVEELKIKRLTAFFEKCRRQVSVYARPEIERVTERLPSLRSLKFPYKSTRGGQNEFIRTAYRAIARGSRLYATAPTGTGKTVSALYPALRALGERRCEKIFYFTPKTTTADVARECLEHMSEKGAKIRAIILTAKEKSCINRHLCKMSKKLCQYAKFNNIANATLHLYNKNLTAVTLADIQSVSREEAICPYELSLAYAELCDVVICDFNYLFDPSVYIRRFFDRGGKYAFLIDEAHNLSERVREGYSAEIDEDFFLRLSADATLSPLSISRNSAKEAGGVLKNTLFPCVKEELREDRDGNLVGATHLSEVPSRLYSLFDELEGTLSDEIFANMRAKDEEAEERVRALRNYHYRIKKFSNILARFDSSYEMFIFYENSKLRIKLFCLDTGPIIREKLALGHGAILFSATLSPLDYYKSILGGERSDEMLEVGSPFDPSQLSVNIMDKISTRYSEREDTLLAVVRAIAAAVSARRGNYMIFSPSFAYSEALARVFMQKYPKLAVLVQKRDMSPDEKKSFLDKFKEKSSSYLIAFCVMGGIYSEGVDLVGESLIGAIIVGVGMPALSYEREAIQSYYNEKYEKGKEYAYIYPGMNRVFQAGGRVIRREDDRGIILLIDDRFDDPIYKKSLPALWEGVKFIADAKELRCELDAFWKEVDESRERSIEHEG